jgi:hypothetical protein
MLPLWECKYRGNEFCEKKYFIRKKLKIKAPFFKENVARQVKIEVEKNMDTTINFALYESI